MKKKRVLLGLLLIVLCTLAISMSAFVKENVIKNKKWISGQGCAYTDTDGDDELDYQDYGVTYYKFKIPRQGYIMIDVKVSGVPGAKEYWKSAEEEDLSSTTVEVLNSSGKKMLEESNLFSGKKGFTFSIALKKGSYYLAVSSGQKYKIRYSFTAVKKTGKGGKGIRSAPALRKQAVVKNLLFQTGKKRERSVAEHYYKISLRQKTKIALVFDVSKLKTVSFGIPFVQIWVKEGKDYRTVDKNGKSHKKGDAYVWSVKGKDKITANLPEGTYYIRIFSLGSGYYTMQWK